MSRGKDLNPRFPGYEPDEMTWLLYPASGLGRARSFNLLIRNQVLDPIELQGQKLPFMCADTVTVRAHHLALRCFLRQLVEGPPVGAELGHLDHLLSPNMVKVHHIRRVTVPAVSTGGRFQFEL